MLRKIIPLFIVFLIFIVPVANASPFMEFVESHGEDGLEGFIRDTTDEVYTGVVKVQSGQIGATPLELNNIIFDTADFSNSIGFIKSTFSDCVEDTEDGNTIHYCTFRDLTDGAAKDITYNYKALLTLGSGDEFVAETNITSDGSLPEYDDYDLSYGNGILHVEAKFMDDGAGIRGVNVSIKPSSSEEYELILSKKYSGQKEINFSEDINYIPSEKGFYDILITYSDGLYSETIPQPNFYMDSEGPDIIECSFGDGGYYSEGSTEGFKIECDVKDDSNSLDIKLVGVPIPDFQGEVWENCTCVGGCSDELSEKNHSCVWRGDVSLEAQQTYTISITIVDESGNTAGDVLVVDASLDEEPPQFENKFYSQGETLVLNENNEEELINYVKEGDDNTLYALFYDNRSGVENATIEEASGSYSITATRCEKANNNYLCVWENVNFLSDTDLYISSVVDGVGNVAYPEFSTRNFVLDNTNPNFIRAEIYSETGIDTIGVGEKMRIIVIANDTIGKVWKIELPSFGEVHEDVCVDDGNNSRCSFLTSGSYADSGTKDLDIKIYDKVGNYATGREQVVVAQREVKGINIWEFYNSSITPSEGLDKRIITRFPQRILATAHLRKIVGGQYDVSGAELRRCSGDISYFLDQPSVFRTDNGVSLLFETNPNAFNDAVPENISLNCEVKVFTASRTKVYSDPETISFDIEIPVSEFVSHPELVGVDKKIEELESDIKNFEWLGSLNEWVKYAKFFCNVRSTAQKVNSVLLSIGYTLDILKAIPYTYPAAVKGCITVSKAESSVVDEILSWEILDKPCKFVSCSYGTIEFTKDIFGGLGGQISSNNLIGKYSDKISKSKNLDDIQSAGKTMSEFGSSIEERGSILALGNTSLGQAAIYGKAAGLQFPTDPYSNVYVAMFKFCLPALVWNAEKLRQIYCQELYCLKNDVKNKIATPAVCSSVRSYSICKYFLGPAIMLFLGPLDSINNFVKSFLTDYSAAVSWLIKFAQNQFCPSEGLCSGIGTKTACRTLFFAYSAIDIANDVIGLTNQWKALQGEDICDLALD